MDILTKRGNILTSSGWKKNFLRTLPVMAGYLVLGIGFGILMESRGYGALWSFAMGGLIYAGSMQFVAADLLSAGAGLITAALTTLLVNARHLFYGVSMLERYQKAKTARPYLIFGLTDETYSLVCGRSDLSDSDLFRITLLDHSYWAGGCLLGGLIGRWIPWDFAGIDFALTALFVCIFTEQWTHSKDKVPALTGIGASLLCLLLFGAERFLLPSMALIVALLCLRSFLTKGGAGK